MNNNFTTASLDLFIKRLKRAIQKEMQDNPDIRSQEFCELERILQVSEIERQEQIELHKSIMKDLFEIIGANDTS